MLQIDPHEEIKLKFRIIEETDSILFIQTYLDSNVNLITQILSLRTRKKINISKELVRFENDKSDKQIIEHIVVQNNNLIEDLISKAISINGSDIHIEKFEYQSIVRMRVDGKLKTIFQIYNSDYPELINKIKIKSNLDISEKRLPQDGRIHLKEIDLRVSTLPTMYGEKIVIRLLNNDSTKLTFEYLGLSLEETRLIKKALTRPNGLILISGPTGSGKTTTLYTFLKNLNNESRNIITIEDPIEYNLSGINQVQLKEEIGLDFPSALRTFLRQDPDIIMVGEIRDSETANMAIRASLTGHLVLSTIHTNSSVGTISRLIDMNIPSFLIPETLILSIAQRLIRKVCKHCSKETYTSEIGVKDIDLSVFNEITSCSIGCEKCNFTGYNGRIGVYEFLELDEEISSAIRSGHIIDKKHLEKIGFESLQSKFVRLVNSGITTLEEIHSTNYN